MSDPNRSAPVGPESIRYTPPDPEHARREAGGLLIKALDAVLDELRKPADPQAVRPPRLWSLGFLTLLVVAVAHLYRTWLHAAAGRLPQADQAFADWRAATDTYRRLHENSCWVFGGARAALLQRAFAGDYAERLDLMMAAIESRSAPMPAPRSDR